MRLLSWSSSGTAAKRFSRSAAAAAQGGGTNNLSTKGGHRGGSVLGTPIRFLCLLTAVALLQTAGNFR